MSQYVLYLRNCPCTPTTGGKIMTLRYFPCLTCIWPAHILHMSRGHPETILYPFPQTSLFHSSLSHNNWSEGALCMRTWYNVNFPTSNHYPNQLGRSLLPAIIELKQGFLFRTPFLFCLILKLKQGFLFRTPFLYCLIF